MDGTAGALIGICYTINYGVYIISAENIYVHAFIGTFLFTHHLASDKNDERFGEPAEYLELDDGTVLLKPKLYSAAEYAWYACAPGPDDPTPNVWVNGRGVMRALRVIRTGERLVFCYGDKFWNGVRPNEGFNGAAWVNHTSVEPPSSVYFDEDMVNVPDGSANAPIIIGA